MGMLHSVQREIKAGATNLYLHQICTESDLGVYSSLCRDQWEGPIHQNKIEVLTRIRSTQGFSIPDKPVGLWQKQGAIICLTLPCMYTKIFSLILYAILDFFSASDIY